MVSHRIPGICFVLSGALLPVCEGQGAEVLAGKTQDWHLRIEGALGKASSVRVDVAMGFGQASTLDRGGESTSGPFVWVDARYAVFPKVTRVHMAIDGRKVLIPQQAFRDVSGIDRGTIWRAGENYFFRVTGGVGGDVFEDVYAIVPYQPAPGHFLVSERRLRRGAGPDGAWERTVFRLSSLGPGLDPCKCVHSPRLKP